MHNILYVKNEWIIECCLSTEYHANGSIPINKYGNAICTFFLMLNFSFLFIINLIIVYVPAIAIEIKGIKYDKKERFLSNTFT